MGKGSWADTLVEDGFDVWLVDVRGYGRSGVPDDVAKAGENSAPFATTQQAVADIASAIDFIRTHRHVDSVNLIAWSWGTVITGSYAAAHVDAVQSLTLLGPVWPRSPSSTQPSSQLGPWAYWTFEDSLNKLQNGAPQNERANLFPAQDRDVWEKALLASQPAAAKSSPAKFRSPTGVVADAREYWGAGKLPYNPEDIRVPTFIVVGQWDAVTPPSGADALYLALKNSPLRSSLHIPRATHFVAVETGRDILIPAVQNFIAEASTAARLEGVRR
ncbi:pimeloyl-ACP methyl ester carboxylesterase [Azomonas macrocytogenes]|uniref:Pimeloyl-ACP methyl ester carboxylesterase n=1 Tax=Azomonas macrocytogenes TaxID=69962 RepID=A0A839T3Y5_AZOMA|nr:pimeloyl-ACP methyl ester carboxylesterase [Azomonas macrocytogenes]